MFLTKCPDKYLATEVDNELILVQAGTGAFFSLKDTALTIWNALDCTESSQALAEQLSKEYDVPPERCLDEVREFADQLVEAGFAQYRSK